MKRKFPTLVLFYARFIPLQRNGLLFIVFGVLLSLFLYREYYADESRLIPWLDVFVWLLAVFAGLTIGLGLVYSALCWLHFLFTRKRTKVELNIGLEDGQKGIAGFVPVKLLVSKVIMPLLGYLKAWLVFEDGTLVGPVVINGFPGGWRDLLAKEGQATLKLERRAEYHVRGILFSFEDYLQFFRFSHLMRHKKAFYLYPPDRDVATPDVPPSKAREEEEKVKTTKRVEGDFINYKDFESGDDVRRIVWKIFAKNKDLVVRIPEIINPYASHLHFLASFQNSLVNHDSTHALGMLDYYKDMVFNTCQQIEKSGRKIEFSIDQTIQNGLIVNKGDHLAYSLSHSTWHDNLLTDQGQSTADASVVCVSSMIPADQLEELVAKRKSPLLVVQVSKYLDEQNLFSWRNLILRDQKQSEWSKLRWVLSSERRLIKKNESRIVEFLEGNEHQGQLI